MDVNTSTEAGQIAALVEKALKGEPQIITTDQGGQLLILPEGYKYETITPDNGEKTLLPDHITARVTLQTVESLVTYLAKYHGAETTLFADIADSTIVGAIDYHGKDKAALIHHKAVLALPYSIEFKTWLDIDGKHMSQLDFARFLEENSDDIASPSGADLLEIVRDMQAVVIENTKATVRTNSDNVDFEFAATTDTRSAGGKFEVPKSFKLFIPIYFGEQAVPMEARLRWKKTQEGVFFGIMLMRKEIVRQGEFQRIVGGVAQDTGLPAIYGHFW